MPTLLTVTLAQLRSYTAAQIATALKNKIDTLTKRQLINLVLAIQSYDTDTDAQQGDDPVVTYGADGQVASQVQVIRNVLGNKVGSKRIDWTYWPPLPGRTQGCVRVIRQRTLDATDKVVTDVSSGEHPNG